MKGFTCIGVHVRHSRHVENRASLQEYAHEINMILRQYPEGTVRIFVASDSYDAINYLKNIYMETNLFFLMHQENRGIKIRYLILPIIKLVSSGELAPSQTACF